MSSKVLILVIHLLSQNFLILAKWSIFLLVLCLFVYLFVASIHHSFLSVVVWDLDRKEAMCCAPAAVLSAGVTFCVAFANRNDNVFVTGGE